MNRRICRALSTRLDLAAQPQTLPPGPCTIVFVDVELVRAFERAVNAGDVSAAVSLVNEDVEVGGPRGSAKGLKVFRDWVAGSGIELKTVRLFGRGDVADELRL